MVDLARPTENRGAFAAQVHSPLCRVIKSPRGRASCHAPRAQNMAVPNVFGAAYAIAGLEPRTGRRWSAFRQIEFHIHSDHFAWIHPHRFLPTLLVRVGRTSGAENCPERQNGSAIRVEGPLLPRSDRDVDQVEVHWVRIGGEIEDLPPLDFASLGHVRWYREVVRHSGRAESLPEAAEAILVLVQGLNLGPMVGLEAL